MEEHTFGSFILGAGLDPNTLILLAIASTLVGMFSHWVKKQYKDNMDVNWFTYFFVTNKMATVQTVAGGLAALIVAFMPIDYTTISGYQVVLQAFAIGYAVDNAFNSGVNAQAAVE